MQNTSTLYNDIIDNEPHWFEVALAIGESGRLIEEHGYVLKFGNTAVLVDSGGAETAFKEEFLISMSTSHSVFKDSYPTVGGAVSGEIDIEMISPVAEIPKAAQLVPYVRATDGTRYSEWLKKGVYYVDTRQVTRNRNGLDVIKIHGYDAMLKFETNYPSDSANNYPMQDTAMVQFLANSIQIQVDPRTFERMDKQYTFPLPVGYSSREVLGIIASAYGGNFIISDEGQLLLIRLSDLPKESNYLTTQTGDILVFGQNGTTTITKTGNPVTLDGAEETPVDALSVSIIPQQSGSGIPSPVNIRDISGYTQCDVVVESGEHEDTYTTVFPMLSANIWDESVEAGYYDASTGQKASNANQIRSINKIPVQPSTSYYIKSPSNIRICQYAQDESFIRADTLKNVVLTTQSNCYYLTLNTFATGSNAYPGEKSYSYDIAINYPSTVTTYTTYMGNTAYNGTLNKLTGALTCQKTIRTFRSSNEWGKISSFSLFYLDFSLNDFVVDGTVTGWLCNKYPFKGFTANSSSIRNADDGFYINDNTFFGKRIFIKDSNYSTVDEFKATLVNSPLVVYGELVTPVEVSVTPQSISTYSGTNEISTNCGEVTVTITEPSVATKILV